MSNTTPESPNAAEPSDDDVATGTTGTDADLANPPSSPVPARGHVNAPESSAAAKADESTPAAVTEEPAAPASAEPTSGADVAAPAAATAAATAPAPAVAPAPVDAPEPVPASDEAVAAAIARSNAEADVADEKVAAYDDAAATAAYATPPAEPETAPAAPAVAGAAVAGSAAVGVAAPAYGAAATPIYVTAPVAPKKKSNRGFGILIALLGTVVFALVYAAVNLVIAAIRFPAGSYVDVFVQSFIGTWIFWIPVIFFFIAMVVLIQILNRAGWWAYIIGGFVVAAVTYFSYAGGVLLQSQAWKLTPEEVGRGLNVLWFTAPAIWAGVVAREVSIWTGLWLAVRGRKLKAKNIEAQAEYDRAIAAGPRGTNGYAPGA